MLNRWFNKENTKLADGTYLHRKLPLNNIFHAYSWLTFEDIKNLLNFVSPLNRETYIILSFIFFQRKRGLMSSDSDKFLKELPETVKKRLYMIYAVNCYMNKGSK